MPKPLNLGNKYPTPTPAAGMDALVSAALEEVCSRLATGITVSNLWPALRGALEAAGLPLGPAVKSALWARLVALRVISLVEGNGDMVPVAAGDPAEKDVEEAERRGVRLLASAATRDNFLGMYEQRFAKSGLSAIQKATLECVGASRTSGATQNDLGKKFDIRGNRFHYIVKYLESQRLLVRQSTIIKVKAHAVEGEDASHSEQSISTNSLYLSRYAKKLNLHQRIEITKKKHLGSNEDGLQEDGNSGVNSKNNVSIHDYIPEMKAICDKLEEASGKALCVKDIKNDLNYKTPYGHRAWRNVLHKLIDAELVEECSAPVDDKVVPCLCLKKKFDSNEFQPNSTASNYKGVKKGQATDQVVELPLNNCIYDMINAQGMEGITLLEIGKRLGHNNSKWVHKRLLSMLQKFNLTQESEVPDKILQYRVWTSKNFSDYKACNALQNFEVLSEGRANCSHPRSFLPHNELDSASLQGNSFVNSKLLLEEELHDEPVGHHLQNNCDASARISQSGKEDKIDLAQRKRSCCCPSTFNDQWHGGISHSFKTRRVSYDKQPCLHGQPSDPAMQKWRRVRSTSHKRKRSADEVTLKSIKRNVQARGSAEKMSEQSTLNEELPKKILSSPTGKRCQSDPVISKTGSTTTYQTKLVEPKNETSNNNDNCVILDTSSLEFLDNHVARDETSTSVPERELCGHEKSHRHSNAVRPSSDAYFKSHEKIVKVNKNKITEKDICKSLAAANALELLKLIFLSRSSTSDVQASLVATLQLYSESEILTAFSVLKEKSFVVAGNEVKPLSKKFFRYVSRSPFPPGSGEKASKFSKWLLAQQKKATDNGIYLYPDLQCGEIVHLCSLVLSGELFISPFIPNEGIGKADEPSSSSPLVVDAGQSTDNIQKHTADKMKLKSSKTKKHRTSPYIESDLCYRREKGFPGIQVALNQEIQRRNHMQVPDENKYLIFTSSREMSTKNGYLHAESHNVPSLSNYSSLNRQLLSESQLENSYSGWPWDAMKKYARELPSLFDNKIESFILSSELFRKAFCVIHQAGEQGVTLSELSQALHPLGMKSVYVVVDMLKRFQLAIKVNAYNGVQIVDSLHISKYHITTLAQCNHSSCSGAPASQIVDNEYPKNLLKEKHAKATNLPGPIQMTGAGQTVIVSNVQSKLSSPHMYNQNFGAEESSSTSRGDNKESGLYCACERHIYQPILPWINGDGTTNDFFYEALSRRIVGYVMQHPGIVKEDIIHRMDVLNPQTCKTLLEKLTSDEHIYVRVFEEPAPTAPVILKSLLRQDPCKEPSKCRKRYFANAMSTFLL